MRLFVAQPLMAGTDLALPEAAARHAMVRRVQPGDALWLFNGSGLDWPAQVLAVGRNRVDVRLGPPQAVARELPQAVTVALVMPANERMDVLVEKATELGVAVIQPLTSERSVLRLNGERAARKCLHWQAVAQAACEQCGRAAVPAVLPVQALLPWLQEAARASTATRWLLSLAPSAQPLPRLALPDARCAIHSDTDTGAALITLSGPEGGFTPAEEQAALHAGFTAVALGPRVLRSETAPLAVLAWLGLSQV
ncbi:MAG: 16S rRNA (uracil(1498)-N(3))-methyltransferase [Rubrivivax sp.]|nr:16S rRNA (uracil(1498)-N(3))-methyltransferase [Rubrivivax sp.]